MSDHNEVSITIRVPVGVGVSTRPNMALGFYDASITMRFPEDSESIPPGDLNTDGVVSPRASTVVGTAEELDTSGMPTGTNVDATNVLNSNGQWTMTFPQLKATTSYKLTVAIKSTSVHHSVKVTTGKAIKKA